MLAARPSVTKVSIERSLDGAVGSRRTRATQVTWLTTVDLLDDANELSAAVECDVAAVTAVLYPHCMYILHQ